MATPFVPYHPGTVQVTNGGKAVVGTGTNFLAYDQYDVLIVDGYWVLLDTITDATHATAKFNYLGGSGSGKAYEWVPQSDVTKALTLFQSLSAAFTSGNVLAFGDLTSAADKLAYFTGAGTMDVTALTAAGRTLLGKADAAAMLTYLGGQPLDSDLAAIAALATSANKLLGLDASGNWSLSTLTAFARTLLGQADAAAMLAYLGGNDAAKLTTGLLPNDRLSAAVLNKPAAAIAGDWDTFTAPGWQSGIIRGDTSNAHGPPGGQYYHLFVLPYQTNKITQVAYPYGGNSKNAATIWMRGNDGSGWGAWVPVGPPTLGTVSQSGGIPTGAIIERGSNSNGEYVKFADGTLICTQVRTDSAQAVSVAHYGGYRSSGSVWVFPAVFAAEPRIVLTPYYVTMFAIARSSVTTSQVTYVHLSVASQASADRTLDAIAVGRWF